MSKDKSQNFIEISLVVPELEVFLARNGLFTKCKKWQNPIFGLILFTEAKSCQNFIHYFTLKTPAGTNLISYLSVTLLLLFATSHRKSSRATFLVILSGYISRTKIDFPTKFCTLAYHKKRYPKTQMWGFTPLDLKIIGFQTEAATVLATLNLPFFIATWRCSKAMLKIVEACILTFTKNRQNFGSSYHLLIIFVEKSKKLLVFAFWPY